ncbi:T-complex protein 1 subunit eta [Monascus purpureus]|uniref:CCT-eta n=1 Tax=Monascus purpureus TaxID=5098 RepID=A0A507R4K9_MONPU|nr:T-complex protein 1 subunit eta [Monascus purpureus]
MAFAGQAPTIVVLKEGTDTSQGKGQVISNINACVAVQSTIKSTLGPYGGDLLLVDGNGKQTITNDGATVMKLLDIVHPAARILTDIARSQDAEVGDGTTSVVVLAGEVLKEVRDLVEQGVSTQTIVKGLRRASAMAVNKIKEIAVDMIHAAGTEEDKIDTLRKLAATAMNSKLIKRNSDFFTKMVVDAVLSLDQEELNEKLIGVKKITGGGLQDSLFVKGVAFKKTFSYAGFEQQPKSFKNPKIVCLNVELELKSEKDNAEVRVEQVSEYQAIVDAEWQIIFNKLEAVYKTGAKVVLSKLPIGDLATQYFADRDIFCAGRVASDDMNRVCLATGAAVQSTCSDIQDRHLGTCGSFEERQIGGERYNIFSECPGAKTCTLVLRGGAEQFIAEVERSLHDAIMIVKRALRNTTIVAGGGACEMELSSYLHGFADRNVPHKQQAVVKAFAKALEVIPRQLCDNAGFDATDILNRLRVEHRKGNTWAGVDFDNEGVRDNMAAFVWEPSLVKVNAIQAAVEAACLILSVDETIKNEESAQPQAPTRGLPPGAAQRALGGGRGRGMPRRYLIFTITCIFSAVFIYRSSRTIEILALKTRRLKDKCLDTVDIQAEAIRHNTITTISNSHLINMVRFRNNDTGARCIKDNKNPYHQRGHGAPPPPPSGPVAFGHGAPQGYNFQYSRCTGKRKALLIGINYFGQKGQLRGCINDVKNVSAYLNQNFGYAREDMVILTDDQQNPMSQPTKANILRAMHWLVKDARPNDSLFFHYSGHGGQTPDEDGDEEDGYDEVIYPVDFRQAGHITDDEMHRIMVNPLQPGVRLTAIFDSCHSGSALDLPYVYSTQGLLKEPNLAKEAGQGLLGVVSAYARGDMGSVVSTAVDFFKKATKGEQAYQRSKQTKTSPADVIMWSGSRDDQTSQDASVAGQATGAMSWAFITALKKNPQQSYVQLLNSIRDELATKYTQKPQLSSSHPLDVNLLYVM